MDTHKNIQLRPDTSDPIPKVGSDPVLLPVPVGQLPDSLSLGSLSLKTWKARNCCEDLWHALRAECPASARMWPSPECSESSAGRGTPAQREAGTTWDAAPHSPSPDPVMRTPAHLCHGQATPAYDQGSAHPDAETLGTETSVPGATLPRSPQLSRERESHRIRLMGPGWVACPFLDGCAFRLVIRRPAGSAGLGLITM